MFPNRKIRLPAVPLRDMVVFPHMMAPFVVGRRPSVLALEAALARGDKRLFLVTQTDPKIDEPGQDDVHPVGVIARVVQHLQLASGNIKVMVEGLQRAQLVDLDLDAGTMHAGLEILKPTELQISGLDEYMAKVIEEFKEYAKLSPHLAVEGVLGSLKTSDPDHFADVLAAHLMISTTVRQELLTLVSPADRLQRIHDILDVEIEKLDLDRQINSRVKKQMEKAQREYYLNEKIKAINEELGRSDVHEEIAEIKEKADALPLSEDAREKVDTELKRLEAMPPVSAEASVIRTYIDWLLDVPWGEGSASPPDIKRSEEVLEEDHFGLDKVKERILEFLAVRQLTTKPSGTILCFVGPPGVGKTSLARSIARATGREFVRLSLGGVRDEAEIRGHRRTYIGALPGQIIQMMKRAGTTDPLILLDEVDKMASDFRGDPSAALLEVLDPEQNHTFHDHYLDVDYDLSTTFFICTANVEYDIPPALLDRMEVIRLSGYTHWEKLQIANDFLTPRQIEKHGLEEWKPAFSDAAIMELIEGYTREAGVRNLEREIASIARKLARRVLVEEVDVGGLDVDAPQVSELLGKPRFRRRSAAEAPEVGSATGLAWTAAGGEILSTEVSLMPGKGTLTLTGMLGDVMQESARAALSYLRSRAERFDLEESVFAETDIHLHVPEGAIPKDGPSAGITMATTLVSAFTKRPVRSDLAMTGEITLRGKVLPVGGVKEKVMAAYRIGLREIILPWENEKDIEDIPEEIASKIHFHLVEHMDQVLELAIVTELPKGTLPKNTGKKLDQGSAAY